MSYCDICEADHYDKCPWDTVKKIQDEQDSKEFVLMQEISEVLK